MKDTLFDLKSTTEVRIIKLIVLIIRGMMFNLWEIQYSCLQCIAQSNSFDEAMVNTIVRIRKIIIEKLEMDIFYFTYDDCAHILILVSTRISSVTGGLILSLTPNKVIKNV